MCIQCLFTICVHALKIRYFITTGDTVTYIYRKFVLLYHDTVTYLIVNRWHYVFLNRCINIHHKNWNSWPRIEAADLAPLWFLWISMSVKELLELEQVCERVWWRYYLLLQRVNHCTYLKFSQMYWYGVSVLPSFCTKKFLLLLFNGPSYFWHEWNMYNYDNLDFRRTEVWEWEVIILFLDFVSLAKRDVTLGTKVGIIMINY